MLTSINNLNPRDIARSVKQGTFMLKLGPFWHLIKSPTKYLLSHLVEIYGEVEASLEPKEVTEIILDLKAPNIVRKYFRPQLTPDPGFKIPAVPLPASMAALGFEMGLNLSVALKTCRFVTVHAGVVEKAGSAILMSAASGGGKSTLTAALHANGYRLFSDEFALLELNTALAHPYPRPISLKQESIPIVEELLGADRISPVISGTPKGNIAYARVGTDSIRRASETAPVKLIVFPNFQQGSQPMARRLNPAEAVMRLVAASTNYSLLGEPAYKAIVNLVKQARAYEITYGDTAQSIRLVEELMGEVTA